jgi:SSS family solute:Na+ symporter
MHLLDWLIVLAYLAGSLWIGFWLQKRSSGSSGDFFLAGRSLPWWVLGTSMVATTFAADTPLAITEMVRGHGIWRNWWWWNIALGGMLGVVFFSRLWRRAEVTTDNELIELRYGGRPAAILRAFKAGWFATVYNFIVMGWVINGMSSVLGVLLHIDDPTQLAWITWTLVAVTVAYTWMSGFYGVAVTDFFQFLLAMGGSILLAVVAVVKVGGLGELARRAEASPAATEHLLDMVPAASSASGGDPLASPLATFIVFVTLTWWASHNADGGGYIIQRMAACRTERDAFKATLWFNVANYALRVWPWILVALASLVMFPELPAADAKLGYPLVLEALLGPGLKGLLLVSFLAAFMSTIDTHLNWGASYLINDLYKRFLKPEATEPELVRASRWATLVLTGVAALVSLFMTSIEKAWIFVWAMGSGIGAVLILRWFWWRINAWSELSALLASIAIAFGFEILAFVQSAPGVYKLFATAPVLFGVTLTTTHKALILVPATIVIWLTVTLLTPAEDLEHLRRFYRRTRPGGWWGPVKAGLPAADQHAMGLGRGLAAWLGGVGLVYGMTFGIGQLLLLHPVKGLGLLALGVGGGWVLWKAMSGEFSAEERHARS